jgi:small subunit ribosomal protein S11
MNEEKIEDVAQQLASNAEEPVKATESAEEDVTKEASDTDGAEGAGDGEEKSKARKARVRTVPAGIAFVKATFNNTIVSIADARGGVIAWSSAGKAGFKGSRKSTAFAATMVAQEAARQAYAKGMHEVEVRMHGAGAGRESAVRAIQGAGIQISAIHDCTAIPHNGCRQRKRRRV